MDSDLTNTYNSPSSKDKEVISGRLIVYPEQEEYWAAFSPQQSQQEFYKEMTEGLPKETNINIEDDPKTLWFIVDQEHKYCEISLGKVLTLPVDGLPNKIGFDETYKKLEWKGTLDMKDPDCINRYQAYLFSDESNKPSPKNKPSQKQSAKPKVTS